MNFSHTACLGGGVIGASWAALFLASGRSVAMFDLQPTVEQQVRSYIERAWPTLDELGLAKNGNPDALTFHASAAEAVAGAQFVQESVPERLEIKQTLFTEIEPILDEGAIVASSASGLTLKEMQRGWGNPERFVLGHPFNPPHLIPLVELVGNDQTDPAAIASAEQFYQSVGKTTIRLRKETPGHVANRLQAAMWREAISLVARGVATVEDVDKAVSAGPGLRWAVMGPTMLFNLGAGAGGLKAFCEHFSETFNGWWDDLGDVQLNDEMAELLTQGVNDEAKGRSLSELAAERDDMIVAIRKATKQPRSQS